MVKTNYLFRDVRDIFFFFYHWIASRLAFWIVPRGRKNECLLITASGYRCLYVLFRLLWGLLASRCTDPYTKSSVTCLDGSCGGQSSRKKETQMKLRFTKRTQEIIGLAGRAECAVGSDTEVGLVSQLLQVQLLETWLWNDDFLIPRHLSSILIEYRRLENEIALKRCRNIHWMLIGYLIRA